MTTLRQLAEAATPGPWIEAGPSFGAPLPVRLDSVVTDFEDEDENVTVCDDVVDPDDCAYIAAANPAAILALLDDLDQTNEMNAQLREQNTALDKACAELEAKVDAQRKALSHFTDVLQSIATGNIQSIDSARNVAIAAITAHLEATK
jgi:Ead/Ea22-like protein